MHLLSFPISLELKGRTLTATFTDAPAMMQVGLWASGRAGDPCGYTHLATCTGRRRKKHLLDSLAAEVDMQDTDVSCHAPNGVITPLFYIIWFKYILHLNV